MRYRLRTLLILLALAPPLIGNWTAIKRHAVHRAAQVSASDAVVAAALTTLVVMRWRIDRSASHSSATGESRVSDHADSSHA
jgi:hypothetical protein